MIWPALLWALCGIAACLPLAVTRGAQAPGLRFVAIDEATGAPVPCRVHLRDAAGNALLPPGLPAWHDHFVIPGDAEIALAPGQYEYELERGPEYFAAAGRARVAPEGTLSVTNSLRRLADLARDGWWSGDLHVHRPAEQIELLMQAEDLHVAEVITWWNDANAWRQRALPRPAVARFDGDRFADLLAGEDERGGGALIFCGLAEPLAIAGAAREYPPSTRYLRAAKRYAGAWVDVEKPFWWDVPIWLATGLADSIGIVHNHMQRGGVLGNEAWGRPRDRARFPGVDGNGLWTQEIYYHALNCGLRIPPSAGSASGVLPNPVGYNRVYAHVPGELTYEKWRDAVCAGRVFVTNGPLLRCTANGQLPGHVFASDGPLQILIEGRVECREPIAALELVRDGEAQPVALPYLMTVHESGWFLVRARAEAPATFRFGSTGPFYVEIGGRGGPVRRASARFFAEWLRERAAGLELSGAREREETLAELRDAERFWQERLAEAVATTPVRGEIVDAATGAPVPARLYIQDAGGRWFFPRSAAPQGEAIRYERRNWQNRDAVEFHTTLSAHPFRIELAPGRYTFTAERGKEYRPLSREVVVGDAPLELRLPLERWVNMAARGWYSGDTHVHRGLAELPLVMLAEDLNVAFPLTHWVTKAFTAPAAGDKNSDPDAGSELVRIDATHVIWPRNTEYEIFTVNGKSHTLGAVFALGHRTVFTAGVPPLAPIAEQAHREGALLDLDKHDWPWSMALVPVMHVDLYELANNHMWRTEFGLTNWSTPAPAYMGLPNDGRSGGERDWIEYTLRNYYTLLNCGLRLRPTAGTASGVHPVPLGFGRVYVHLPSGFSYEAWLEELGAGRSFVTTGPMLLATIDGEPPGHRFGPQPAEAAAVQVEGVVLSEGPVEEVEIVMNGAVAAHRLEGAGRNGDGAWECRFSASLERRGSAWIAVRCWERREGGRVRFAHTAPSFFDVPGMPLRPRREEVEFLIGRVRAEIARSAGMLPAEAVAEYEEALAVYERIAADAMP